MRIIKNIVELKKYFNDVLRRVAEVLRPMPSLAPLVFKTRSALCELTTQCNLCLFFGFLILTTRLPLGVFIDKPQLAHSGIILSDVFRIIIWTNPNLAETNGVEPFQVINLPRD